MSLAAPLALLLAAAPASPTAPRLSVPYTMFRLPNGLTVIVHEDHSAPVATVNCWYHVGSGRETPGRTGFAHLFEHLMFEGSKNVPEGAFDRWLEAVGGDNNGSTQEDRTNYYEDVPANAVEMPLFLESDRMGFLLDNMTPTTIDGQRDVVKNERRQGVENQPYGKVEDALPPALFPRDHPYSWPVIGSMADLSAASHEDVKDFFRKWYGPANASLVIAGDVDTAEVKAAVEKWFKDVPKSDPVEPIAPRPVVLREEKRLVLEDRVQLPRLYMAWVTPPAFAPGDAALDAVAGVLAGGKNSRLYKRLVYEMQIAQDVTAFQQSQALASAFQIVATPRPGHTVDELKKVIDEELQKLQKAEPDAHELERSVNQIEASFYNRMERTGGFGGKGDQLNAYYTFAGDPDWFAEDLARYRSQSPSDVRAAAAQFLPLDRRVELVVEPEKKQ
jgi:zinc protease